MNWVGRTVCCPPERPQRSAAACWLTTAAPPGAGRLPVAVLARCHATGTGKKAAQMIWHRRGGGRGEGGQPRNGVQGGACRGLRRSAERRNRRTQRGAKGASAAPAAASSLLAAAWFSAGGGGPRSALMRRSPLGVSVHPCTAVHSNTAPPRHTCPEKALQQCGDGCAVRPRGARRKRLPRGHAARRTCSSMCMCRGGRIRWFGACVCCTTT